MVAESDHDALGLSRRGALSVANPSLPRYLIEHFARSAPGAKAGYIPMCIAENRLVWDLLTPKVHGARLVPEARLGYEDMIGSLDFRQQLGDFFADHVVGKRLPPEHIAVLAGAGSILESLFWAIADPGEGVLVPTPSYAGFWMDLEGRDELRIVPVHTSAETNFRLTPRLLDAALASAPVPIRAVLFTSPNNPLGAVYSANEIAEIVAWGRAAGVHLVFDEIYALSIHGATEFVSVAEVTELGNDVHIVWAFSKDFAASGLRCGVLISENQNLLSAVGSLAYWACCSGDSQHLCGELVSDHAWLANYLTHMRARLKESYHAVTSVLAEATVPFVPAAAGVFLVLDLRRYLPEPSFAGEDKLWRRFLDEENLNLTPGSELRCEEPGWFRMCFASVPRDVAATGAAKLVRVLQR